MKNTFEGFVAGVKQQYEVSKNGIYSSFLLHPSPAQLRNLCLLLLENELSNIDEEIFRVFFQVQEGAMLRKAIENFDIEKFRAVVNFLKGKSGKTNPVSLNLISILVDYQPRPFNKYLKVNGNTNLEVISEEKEEIQGIETFFYGLLGTTSQVDNPVKSISLRVMGRVVVLVLLLLGSVYMIKKEFFPKKECMQWHKDHYETVDCSGIKQGILSQNDIMPINEGIINLKKIEVNKQTLFFKNGQPLVWYSKIKGKLYYFNSYGMNPETGKPLKPMTDYMINKYVMKQEITSN
ncbi:hypothetical protein [Flavobacterium sp.]|uniref:hypothetical protein n=1 Tax=Flavobacterium sp. TaxID=239 RepID=UPI0038FCF2B4